jgi:hypothetical protein
MKRLRRSLMVLGLAPSLDVAERRRLGAAGAREG